MEAKVLLVDDDSEYIVSLNRALKSGGLEASIEAYTDPKKALVAAEQNIPHVAVIDLSLDDQRGVESGFELLNNLRSLDSAIRVIVLTGHGSAEYGIRALEEGAASFLEKPPGIDHLIALIRDAIAQSNLKRQFLQATGGSARVVSSMIIGESRAAQDLLEKIEYAAETPQPVLLLGETGTGKGLCARVIHQLGNRSAEKLVRYQPAFTSLDIVNSDLFGHKKGSFTGADTDRSGIIREAHGGTLFLDEIIELPLEAQVTLLGVLQDKTYRPLGSSTEEQSNFRLICATNGDLEAAVRRGQFREDFFHRIAHLSIEVPPLRDRKEDIPLLAEYFLKKLQESEELPVYRFSENAFDRLQTHNWPGNIRELSAVVEGAAYKARFEGRSQISAEDIQILRQSLLKTDDKTTNFHERVLGFKQKVIEEALQNHDGNQVHAARALGIDRSTLRRILS